MEIKIDITTLEEWLPEVDNPKKCRGCGHIVEEFADENYRLCADCVQLKQVFPTKTELEEMRK